MSITMQEIADLAGVSRPVVSAVLNGKKSFRVADETRMRILSIAAKQDYHPNLQAQRLRSGRSRTVGLLFPSFRDTSLGELMDDIYFTLLQHGYMGIFAFWNCESEIKKAYDTVLANQVDGLVTYGNHPEYLAGAKIPCVVYAAPAETDCVTIDYRRGYREILTYLHKLGHRKIAYIGGGTGRFKYFAEVIPEFGGISDSFHFQRDGFDIAGEGIQYFHRMNSGRPTAVVCHNDAFAIASINAALRLGWQVGRELSIVGMDNVREAAYTFPPLTTADTRIAHKAGLIVDMLLRRMANLSAPPEKIVLTPRLVVRNSCGPVSESSEINPS